MNPQQIFHISTGISSPCLIQLCRFTMLFVPAIHIPTVLRTTLRYGGERRARTATICRAGRMQSHFFLATVTIEYIQ